MVRILAGLLLCLSSVGVAMGQVVESSPKTVVMYENGVAWVVEEAVGGAPSNTLSTRIHAVPLEGSVWVSTQGQVDVMSVRFPPQPGAEAGLAELLLAADAPSVYVMARGKTTRGKLLGVTGLSPKGPQVVLLETAEGQVALPVELVESIELEGKPLNGDVLRGGGSRRVDVRFVKSAAPIVSMGYYTTGLGWVPEYRLMLPEKPEKGDKATLEIEAWAVVRNDALTLRGVKGTLISGKPGFGMSATPSTLVRPFVVAGAGKAGGSGVLGSGGMGSGTTALVALPQGVEGVVLEAGGPVVSGGAPAGASAVVHGPLELWLERGQRGMVPLGRASTKGRSVILAEASGAHSGPGDNRFYEAVVFQNPFSFAMIPGTALAVRAAAALGQGAVTRAAAQEEVRVKLSGVGYLTLEVKETSVEKDGDVVKGPDGEYQKLVVKGTVKVASAQKGKTYCWVDMPLAGEVKDASDESTVTKVAAVDGAMNPSSRIRWEVEVEQGSPVLLEYEFTTLVRHFSKSSY